MLLCVRLLTVVERWVPPSELADCYVELRGNLIHKVICEPGAFLQSTIDFLNNWKEKSLLAKEGHRWHNPHDHGMLANWKVNPCADAPVARQMTTPSGSSANVEACEASTHHKTTHGPYSVHLVSHRAVRACN